MKLARKLTTKLLSNETLIQLGCPVPMTAHLDRSQLKPHVLDVEHRQQEKGTEISGL